MICQTLSLVLTLSALLQTSLSESQTPADHLVPPPLPIPQYLAHSKAPTYAQPQFQDAAPLGSNSEQQHGFMTRIARWFGYGPDATAGPREQQLIASNVNPQFANPSSKHAYSYPNPNQQQQNGKAPCHLCSKYPWVPMLPPSIQYPQNQQYHQKEYWPKPHQNIEVQASKNYHQSQSPSTVYNQPSGQISQQHLPVKQRAVQFNFPSFNNYQSAPQKPKLSTKSTPNSQRPTFSPIPFPSLSASAIPPLYNAQPFRPIFTSTQSPFTTQQLPSTEAAHFAENIGAHSELQPDSVIPAHLLSHTNAKDPSFEIVKSHQLTDFVSSVEYPASYVQSPAIDLDDSQDTSSHHNIETNSANTVKYQHEHLKPNLSQHIPASQILTELGNFGEPQQAPLESTTPTQMYEETTSQYTPQFESQFLILNSQQSETIYEGDNFPSASSHNITAIQQAFNNDNEFTHTTTEPYVTQPIPSTDLEFATQSSQQSDTRFITQHFQKPTVEFVPSLQTEYFQQHSSFDITPAPIHRNRERIRETPKRLLDAPIHYNTGSSALPRPFTREPNEFEVRMPDLGLTHKEFKHPNHAYTNNLPLTLPQRVTSVPQITVSAAAAAPTPTSTYSAIDASGQFAGMSPPAPPPAAPHKGIHQIVIPYTTKNQPRPFKNLRGAEATTHAFDKWSHANGVELHEQQESKLVSSATEAPKPPLRTTKYLTKILASNLRDLLKREHEVKNNTNRSHSLSFDVSKLQKNIDDWTEQEYTSLSHRPSTPTIRGRSKHIPTEYLTITTPSTRKAKTTQGFDAAELSASINNLEPLLFDRGSKRFEYVPIDDNRLLDLYDATTTSTTTTTTTAAPRISDDPSKQFVPFYIRAVPKQEPTELWQKARVSISPQTNEKIYVVTPQPRFFPQRVFVTSTEIPLTNESSGGNSFKSPRFLVRPAPGNGTSSVASYSRASTASALYTPELFGLMGLSAYVPVQPVEINDGNSKVITIVTPASGAEKDSTKSFQDLNSQNNRPKSTMSPSPR